MISKWFKKKLLTLKGVDVSRLNSNVIALTGKHEYPANCWNATKLFFGHGNVEFTSPLDMEEWLKTNTAPNETKSYTFGTILVFRRDEELLHTAVYVAPNLLWHKRGIRGHWEFITLKQAKEIYFEANNFEHRLIKFGGRYEMVSS